MARNMITGIETQKMQEYTQEQIDRAEHMGIAIPADVKEQIFEYANLVGEEEKVRTLEIAIPMCSARSICSCVYSCIFCVSIPVIMFLAI